MKFQCGILIKGPASYRRADLGAGLDDTQQE